MTSLEVACSLTDASSGDGRVSVTSQPQTVALMRLVAFVVALVACVHLGLWVLIRDRSNAPNFNGQLASVSYAPYRGSDNPDNGSRPTAANIRADLKLLAPYTRSVRTYSSTAGVEMVAPIANEFGIRASVGVWLDKDAKRNQRELRSAIELVRRNRNIDAIVIGNETVYRGESIFLIDRRLFPEKDLEPRKDGGGFYDEDSALPKDPGFKALTPEEQRLIATARNAEEEKRLLERVNVARLMLLIQRIKREVQSINPNVQVTTGEIWSVWRDHPELASSVDFIAAHVLPYWEGQSETVAVDESIRLYNTLRQAYPGKRVVIAEFGWPSAGYNRRDANPGRNEQAAIVRDFVARAEAQGIDYNIIEAFDQPWKTFEGGVGPYWGLFDANRQPKFTWTGIDHRRRSLEADWARRFDRHPAVIAGACTSWRDRRPSRDAVGRRACGRRLGRDRVRLLAGPLLRDGRRVRALAWADPAGAAGPDRALAA